MGKPGDLSAVDRFSTSIASNSDNLEFIIHSQFPCFTMVAMTRLRKVRIVSLFVVAITGSLP